MRGHRGNRKRNREAKERLKKGLDEDNALEGKMT